MRYYADSSFLVSCYVVDTNTSRARLALSAVHTPLDFTDLHELEVQNALQLGVFRGDLTAAQAAAARANLRKDLKNGRLVRTVVKWPEIFRAATRLSSSNLTGSDLRIPLNSFDLDVKGRVVFGPSGVAFAPEMARSSIG